MDLIPAHEVISNKIFDFIDTLGYKEEKEEMKIVDLKGVRCPINFVKAKIELAKIPSREIIGYYLDDGESIKNVPGSVEGEGHSIINVDTNFEE